MSILNSISYVNGYLSILMEFENQTHYRDSVSLFSEFSKGINPVVRDFSKDNYPWHQDSADTGAFPIDILFQGVRLH